MSTLFIAEAKIFQPAPTEKAYVSLPKSVLVEHVIYSEDHVTDPAVCAGYCTLHSQCKSFNYNSQRNTCEISKASATEEQPTNEGDQAVYYELVESTAASYDPRARMFESRLALTKG